MDTQSKYCTSCYENLPLSMFYRNRTTYIKVGYLSKCKQCCKEMNNLRKNNIKDTTLINKICKTCNKEKEISYFYKSTRHIDGFFKDCKECVEMKRKNKGNNPRFKRTPEYMKEYIQNRKKDPQYRMRYALRSNLSSAVERIQGGVKSKRTMEYLKCSLTFFQEWFEFLFDENMSWENYGSYWHIDHIKPCASFDLSNDKDIMECYHWSNLRPCKKEDNIKKGDVYDEKLIQEYITYKNAFLGMYEQKSISAP
jgi:hypothetical protein